jgi:glycosyl transferase family 2
VIDVPETVTVCIPAFQSEAFIDSTLRSVLAQTYPHFVVDIAIEPPSAETFAACKPFLHDERVRVGINPTVLGWAANMDNLLQRVATPYFILLSHDDLLAPDYIATLLDALRGRPEANVVYSDTECFGRESCELRLPLKEEPLFDRLMSFFLGGAEAGPMKGVTRSAVRRHCRFPTDSYDGFAVECEWVLNVLLSGSAVRVPRPLYFKRTFNDRIPASEKRLIGRTRAHLLEALEDHRMRMLKLAQEAELPPAMTERVVLAVEAAMLRRHMSFCMGALSPTQLDRSKEIVRAARTNPDPYGNEILGMTLLVQSHHALIGGDAQAGVDLAVAAVEADPLNWETPAHLAKLHLGCNRGAEALATAKRAWALAPRAPGLEELIADCELNLEVHDLLRKGQAVALAERFDAARYLRDHPDVAAAAVDPWQHFYEFGLREGRKFHLLPH